MAIIDSNNQVKKLGERLRGGDPSPDDLDKLAEFRSWHIKPLGAALKTVQDSIPATSALSCRIKNTATILEKLERDKTRLNKMQDIAGVRIVLTDGGHRKQDDVVASLKSSGLFRDLSVEDRRRNPNHGYRAVHVNGTIGRRNVEIQVRTKLQHGWAQMFERLADIVGRQIRYGKPPSDGPDITFDGVPVSRAEVVAQAHQLSESIYVGELASDDATDIWQELQAFREVLHAARLPGTQAEGASPIGPFNPERWYLVTYDRARGIPTNWLSDEPGKLVDRWRELDAQHRGDPNVEVVLLASKSFASLKATHERYFSPEPGFGSAE